jgi:D-arginine dehydrogenase
VTYDFAIIGGGIAGASVAACVVGHGPVVLLEAEDVCGYHSTGRSAAFWHETLGGPVVQLLSKASLRDLEDGGFLHARVSLEVAEVDQIDRLDAFAATFEGTGAALTRVDAEGVRARVPRAKPILVAGLVEESCADIDVAALHQTYLSAFKKGGGLIETGFRAESIERVGDVWQITSGDRVIEAKTVVNAAGAWADKVAVLAGAKPLSVQPKQRTIAQCRVNGEDVPADLPLVMDIAGTYYFKPEGPNRVWVSPHDETPVEAGDVAPEELDVAIAIDRFETVTNWTVTAVERKWAGLRSFAPDRLPVYGFDPEVDGFFWCAGQGGFGIQTAPAAGKLCAAMLLAIPPDGSIAHIDPAPYAPGRFATGTSG